MADFEAAVKKTIQREGGEKFTNDPADPGGPTRYGIAQKYHPGVNAETLTEDQAKSIYRREYWNPIRGDEIKDQFVAELIFDSAVNPGIGATLRILQACLGLPMTKMMDDATIAIVNGSIAHDVVASFLLGKIAHYLAACRKDPTKKKFFFGWVSRTLLIGSEK